MSAYLDRSVFDALHSAIERKRLTFGFCRTTWRSTLNKNQLRNQLRKYIQVKSQYDRVTKTHHHVDDSQTVDKSVVYLDTDRLYQG